MLHKTVRISIPVTLQEPPPQCYGHPSYLFQLPAPSDVGQTAYCKVTIAVPLKRHHRHSGRHNLCTTAAPSTAAPPVCPSLCQLTQSFPHLHLRRSGARFEECLPVELRVKGGQYGPSGLQVSWYRIRGRRFSPIYANSLFFFFIPFRGRNF